MTLRKNIIELENFMILCYFDNFEKSYQLHPEDFNVKDIEDNEYPIFWFQKFTHCILEIFPDLKIEKKNFYSMVLFNFLTTYNKILYMSLYKNFKNICIQKAQDLIQTEECSEENINALKKFLEVMGE